MNANSNILNWFEIPVSNMDRAKNFYEKIFAITMNSMPMGEFEMVTFPFSPGGSAVSGALIKHEMYEPRDNGVLLYLNANPEIQSIIDRIEQAGGTILVPKTQISEEIGYMSVFLDTEGNRIALHAQA